MICQILSACVRDGEVKTTKDKKEKETKDEGYLYNPIALCSVFGYFIINDINTFRVSGSFYELLGG